LQTNDNIEASKADVAVLLGKIEGYGYAIDSELPENRYQAAVDILESTGYYSKLDFYPAKAKILRRELINLLAKTRTVTQKLISNNEDTPAYWLELPVSTEQMEHRSIYINIVNASKFSSVESLINRFKKVYPIENDQSMRIEVPLTDYNDPAGLDIKITLKDKYGNVYTTKVFYAYSKEAKRFTIQQKPTTEKVDLWRLLTKEKPVRPVKQVKIEPSFQEKYNLLIKTSPEKVKRNEKFSIYAGIMPRIDEDLTVRFVFSDGKKAKGERVNPYLWKFDKRIKTPGDYYVKVFIKNADGDVLAKKLEFKVN